MARIENTPFNPCFGDCLWSFGKALTLTSLLSALTYLGLRKAQRLTKWTIVPFREHLPSNLAFSGFSLTYMAGSWILFKPTKKQIFESLAFGDGFSYELDPKKWNPDLGENGEMEDMIAGFDRQDRINDTMIEHLETLDLSALYETPEKHFEQFCEGSDFSYTHDKDEIGIIDLLEGMVLDRQTVCFTSTFKVLENGREAYSFFPRVEITKTRENGENLFTYSWRIL